MMIEFECPTLIRDSSTGQTYVCGCRIIVPSETMGDQTVCPRCKKSIEVPFPKRRESQPENQSSLKPQVPAAKPKTKAPAVNVDSRVKSGNDEFGLAAPISRPKSDLGHLDFSETHSSPIPLAKTQRTRCQKCGERCEQGIRCPSCGQLAPASPPTANSQSERPVGLTGFQLWFVKTMTESIPFPVLELATHASTAILVLLFSFVSVFAAPSFLTKLLLLMCIGLAAAGYVALVLKGRQMARDPHATLSWYQKPFWNALLLLARSQRWQKYDHRLAGRKIIDERGQGLTDTQLRELEGFEKAQVFDLERTAITDQGLRHLAHLKHLHCVVVRHTQVTREGIAQLQQAQPQAWIWY